MSDKAPTPMPRKTTAHAPLPACLTATCNEAGCDEAGRGCLAGPVFAAAVILRDDFAHPLLNDSKQLTHHQRLQLEPLIRHEAIAWAVAQVSPKEIDKINILNASILAMHRALDIIRQQYDIIPGHIIVDGNKFKPWQQVPHQTIVKGDGKYANIAAASILAKTHRDAYMTALAKDFPQYHWEINKGYPTAEHRAAIATYGPTIHHRQSFRLLPHPTIPGL